VKTLTVRLPEPLAAAIEAEARARRISKSDVVRERLERAATAAHEPGAAPYDVADLVGSVDGLPSDLGVHKKRYLKTTGYGRRKRTR
jgi:hypothetical protein